MKCDGHNFLHSLQCVILRNVCLCTAQVTTLFTRHIHVYAVNRSQAMPKCQPQFMRMHSARRRCSDVTRTKAMFDTCRGQEWSGEVHGRERSMTPMKMARLTSICPFAVRWPNRNWRTRVLSRVLLRELIISMSQSWRCHEGSVRDIEAQRSRASRWEIELQYLSSDT